jgi:hypothetical protein
MYLMADFVAVLDADRRTDISGAQDALVAHEHDADATAIAGRALADRAGDF